MATGLVGLTRSAAVRGSAYLATRKATQEALELAVQKQCFVAGTLIHTKDGLKAIEDIQIGDLVLSKDDQTGEVAYKPVV